MIRRDATLSPQYSITHPEACWAHVTCSQEQYEREVEGRYSLDTPGCRPGAAIIYHVIPTTDCCIQTSPVLYCTVLYCFVQTSPWPG